MSIDVEVIIDRELDVPRQVEFLVGNGTVNRNNP